MRFQTKVAATLGATAMVLGMAGPAQASPVGGALLTGPGASSVAPDSTYVSKIDLRAPHSTYVVANYRSVTGGIQIYSFKIYGIQRCYGRTQAQVWVNGRLYQYSSVRYYDGGTRLIATFNEGWRFASIGTKFKWQFAGSCAPAGYESATVVPIR